jgi:hypothetical protein
MEMKKPVIIAVCLLALAGCKNESAQKHAQLKTLGWLQGRWEMQTDGGTLSETWRLANDSTFQGAGYFIKNGNKDTLHRETIELIERDGVVSYNPAVEGQNGGLPVAFRMTSNTGKSVVFENPAHDYPQKISYKMITNDSIVASISGRQRGAASSEQFGMKRK